MFIVSYTRTVTLKGSSPLYTDHYEAVDTLKEAKDRYRAIMIMPTTYEATISAVLESTDFDTVDTDELDEMLLEVQEV